MTSDLRITWDWEPAPGVRAAEHRATWARIEIQAGGDTVTLVEDRETGSSRRSIYCPLYPLAEWVAFNWWLLRADTRPSRGFMSADVPWHRLSRRTFQRHSFRGAGDGFLWPNLLVVPEGVKTRLMWRRDRDADAARPVRFISDGDALVDGAEVSRVLSSLVSSVLTRLAEEGVTGTRLEHEWQEISQADGEEEAYCLAAARLGLDPYAEAEKVEAAVARASEVLTGRVFDDFMDAVDPDMIDAGVAWLVSDDSGLAASPAQREGTAELRRALATWAPTRNTPPWQQGWQQARQVRRTLGAEVSERFEPERYVRSFQRPTADRSLQGAGRADPKRDPVVVLSRPGPSGTRRFTLSRAFWHLVWEPDPLFLVTSAYTERQKVERAFTAELLAPAAGIEQMLDSPAEQAAPEDLEQIAEHFRVSPMVVEHQVKNQLADMT